jgi:GTP-binding protein
MFDVVRVRVQGGRGGKGAITFRREKYVPYGGPDGGDGGDGGAVVLVADQSVATFKEFIRGGLYHARDGEDGRGQKKVGKRGGDLLIRVPVGTIVHQSSGGEENAIIADLVQPQDRVVVACGGKGGWGNVHYATSTNQTPRLAQVGGEGEQAELVLELRLIADVGIIGYPNVGKSSLLAAASHARPRIADYPFTTKEPELGVVQVDNETFVLAEIPGLIEGAHQGRGLGYEFLRHSTRTRAFIHLVSGDSESPVNDMIKVNNELALYDAALAQRPQIVAVNKIDLPEVRQKMAIIEDDFAAIGTAVRFISAASGEGVPDLMRATFELVKRKAPPEAAPPKIFRPQPRRRAVVDKEGDAYVIHQPDIERVCSRVDLEDETVRWQLHGLLVRKGIGRELEKAGIKEGDKVRCGDAEWEW